MIQNLSFLRKLISLLPFACMFAVKTYENETCFAISVFIICAITLLIFDTLLTTKNTIEYIFLLLLSIMFMRKYREHETLFSIFAFITCSILTLLIDVISHSYETIDIIENPKSNDYNGEEGYLNLMKDIASRGHTVPDRTGVGVKFLSGCTVKYDINNFKLPLFTSRRISWKIVVEELLFFLRGDTDTTLLEEQKVNIWKANTSKDFIAKRKLDLEPGDMGPLYGFQWRHFGADWEAYKKDPNDEKNQGFDQITWLMNELKTNPYSRRLVLTALNPPDISKSVLAPCHFSAQWCVRDSDEKHGEKIIDCILYQRSCDLPLGCPTNVPSYALLTFIFAWYCDMKPGTLTHSIGHAHVYENQMTTLETHLERLDQLEEFPTLNLMNQLPKNINDITRSYFKIHNYNHLSSLKYPFAV